MALELSDNNERILLVFTIVISVAISLPLVWYHISHIDGILHMMIHAVGFVIASFLTTITLISWKKTRMSRMILSSFAFSTLALAQGIYMYLERDVHKHLTFENEIFDILIVIVTIFFGIGVFYKR